MMMMYRVDNAAGSSGWPGVALRRDSYPLWTLKPNKNPANIATPRQTLFEVLIPNDFPASLVNARCSQDALINVWKL